MKNYCLYLFICCSLFLCKLEPSNLMEEFKGKYSTVFMTQEEEGKIKIEIETERLLIQSLEPKYFSYYSALRREPHNCTYFFGGTIPSLERTQKLAHMWYSRFQKGDPFSAFTIFKKEDHQPIGYIVLGKGSNPDEEDASGYAEYAIMLDFHFWGQKFGVEAAMAVVLDYAVFLKSHHFLVNGGEVRYIMASVHPDNLASIKIMADPDKLGMTFDRIFEYEGQEKYLYCLDIEKLMQSYEKSGNF